MFELSGLNVLEAISDNETFHLAFSLSLSLSF